MIKNLLNNEMASVAGGNSVNMMINPIQPQFPNANTTKFNCIVKTCLCADADMAYIPRPNNYSCETACENFTLGNVVEKKVYKGSSSRYGCLPTNPLVPAE